ncbi:PREDICTED: centrosomal protein of 89 kDa-like [Dufourea novaeangliae]|uniref:centrosomal protein of 89 kDa-like n=1 Tax=Dufourea novaeangliae TaxID=178035 RepID=UPI0007670274|nr:PREDICTED: centrosomal protein of 89 kDa-like [Dufourea novaeangliae]
MSLRRTSSEATCMPVYRRRRISKARHNIATHNEYKDSSDYVTNNAHDPEGDTYYRGRSKRSGRCRKTNEENNVETHKCNEGDADSGIISSRTRDKRLSKDILKIANDYHKLEKRFKSVQEECQMLNRMMEQREVEYQKMCSQYDAMVQMVQEMEETNVQLNKRNQKLEAEKTQSDEDITLLKSIVYQLNAELERYQDKMKGQKLKTSSTEFVRHGNEGRYNQRVWSGVNFHALGPLLNAYQQNLAEKQELVNMYEQEMANFGNRCKEILSENERMHQEVKELKSECDRYAKEIKTTIENTTLLKKQNDFLQKETTDLKKELTEIRSSYESKFEALLKRNEVLKKEHSTSMSELSSFRGKYEVLSKEFEKIKTKEDQTVPITVHTAAVEECKTLLDELKHRYETEKRNLSNHIRRIEETRPETEKELVMITAERNHLKTLVASLQANLKRTQRKNEHLHSQVYSTRVSRDSAKEQLSKATAYCEELFSEYERIVSEREKLLALLRETEKENASIDRLGKSISSRVNGLKNQLESVRRGAKQQVETVEKRIKLQEVRARKMKHEYRRKIQQLKEIIKQKDETIASLQEKPIGRNKSTRHLLRAVDDEKLEAVPSEERIHNL